MVSALDLAQREELAKVENEIRALEEQLAIAREEELTLQPPCDCLDPEAAKPGIAQRQQPNVAPGLVGPTENPDDRFSEQLEAEIQVMERDIFHFREQLEHLQNSERLRTQELDGLSRELTRTAEHLAYELQAVRVHEDCLNSICSACSSPNLIGPRTIELRMEQRLKALAVRRTSKLSDEVMKLAVGAKVQQTTVDSLSMKLLRVRSLLHDKDRELLAAQKATVGIESRLVSGAVGSSTAGTAGRCMPSKTAPASSSTRNRTGTTAARKAVRSTGRLPQSCLSSPT
eukprot:CAMPEP_0172662546 /NCGR_PEP_ID=MMETSP1074-20121228/5423_1 /TAXON_ID=2916 /ORGANISM="Ceratium fusus, Strain PA161109" /LENGTH=286 /DNA_ID=CAMNT_0013478471 /DNA_START=111 /DNA_END=967 /DNA_ORIENTATION=+